MDKTRSKNTIARIRIILITKLLYISILLFHTDNIKIQAMGSPERIQVPVAETKPFYTPEGSKVGPVGLLDKPQEVKKPVSISSTATHETGHTLVGWLRNVGIDQVNII